MYRKFIAASVLTIGLATSAMAQPSEGTYSNHHTWFGNEQSSGVDQNTTGSINATALGWTASAIPARPDLVPPIHPALMPMPG